jgi:uncharacterized membrane protein YphA (DoxX/SURF4 family)
MTLPFLRSRAYESWAPFLARVIFGIQFLMGAAFKIPGTAGFTAEAGMTAAAGVPFATAAVFVAFVLEVVAGICLIVGFKVRETGFVLAVFVAILTAVFYRNVADQMTMGMMMSHLAFIAGLLYVSVYGARSMAFKKDA